MLRYKEAWCWRFLTLTSLLLLLLSPVTADSAYLNGLDARKQEEKRGAAKEAPPPPLSPSGGKNQNPMWGRVDGNSLKPAAAVPSMKEGSATMMKKGTSTMKAEGTVMSFATKTTRAPAMTTSGNNDDVEKRESPATDMPQPMAAGTDNMTGAENASVATSPEHPSSGAAASTETASVTSMTMKVTMTMSTTRTLEPPLKDPGINDQDDGFDPHVAREEKDAAWQVDRTRIQPLLPQTGDKEDWKSAGEEKNAAWQVDRTRSQPLLPQTGDKEDWKSSDMDSDDAMDEDRERIQPLLPQTENKDDSGPSEKEASIGERPRIKPLFTESDDIGDPLSVTCSMSGYFTNLRPAEGLYTEGGMLLRLGEDCAELCRESKVCEAVVVESSSNRCWFVPVADNLAPDKRFHYARKFCVRARKRIVPASRRREGFTAGGNNKDYLDPDVFLPLRSSQHSIRVSSHLVVAMVAVSGAMTLL